MEDAVFRRQKAMEHKAKEQEAVAISNRNRPWRTGTRPVSRSSSRGRPALG